jgi:hypothetical protein
MLNLESTEFSEEIYQSLGTGWVKDSPDPGTTTMFTELLTLRPM